MAELAPPPPHPTRNQPRPFLISLESGADANARQIAGPEGNGPCLRSEPVPQAAPSPQPAPQSPLNQPPYSQPTPPRPIICVLAAPRPHAASFNDLFDHCLTIAPTAGDQVFSPGFAVELHFQPEPDPDDGAAAAGDGSADSYLGDGHGGSAGGPDEGGGGVRIGRVVRLPRPSAALLERSRCRRCSLSLSLLLPSLLSLLSLSLPPSLSLSLSFSLCPPYFVPTPPPSSLPPA